MTQPAECDSLRARVKELEAELLASNKVRDCCASAAALRAQRIAVVEEALRLYGDHAPTCSGDGACDCGWDAAREAIFGHNYGPHRSVERQCECGRMPQDCTFDPEDENPEHGDAK